MKIHTTIITMAVCLVPYAAQTMNLELPGLATVTASKKENGASTGFPVGPFSDGKVDVITAKGEFRQEAWKIPNTRLSTLEILDPMRTQLEDEGFETLFDCKDKDCGGFDFRFALEVLPEPDMHVDLGNYRFLTARKTEIGEDPEFVSLLVSRSSTAAFVQFSHIGAPDLENGVAVASSKVPGAGIVDFGTSLGSLGKNLDAIGRTTLEDLTFETGSSSLADQDFQSLAELAEYLREHPSLTIAFVGHTDSAGSLEANIVLSRKRATSVLDRLVEEFDISRGRVEANGVGYLSPRASNLTEDGRAINRRVEVIITSTQ